MIRQSEGGTQPVARLRRWAVRIGIACLVVEAVYLVAGNLCIRKGVLERVINYEPEANFVSWKSAVTYLPGFVSFKDFTYRSQSMNSQMYVHMAEVDARISLAGLLFKKVHIWGVDARDVDYRHRDRIDFPCWTEESGTPPPEMPADLDFYPEIPGFENPPDPKPEDLYPRNEEARPWTVKISGARIRGVVRVAFNEIRLEGQGSIGGGVTVVLGKSNEINRGRVRVAPATVLVGPTLLTDDLGLDVDVRVKPFSTVCSDQSEIIAGLSGSLTFAGGESNAFSVNVAALDPLLPGQGVLSITSGTGELVGHLEVGDGILESGRLDLVADDVVLEHQEVPLQGDLKVHAVFAKRALETGRFDVSGTTFRLDDIVNTQPTAQQEKLDPWFCDLEFEEGILTFGEPMALDSRVRVKMHDTRPVVALLRNFTNQLKWLSMTRNAKSIDGTMDLDFGKGFVAVDDLRLFGENVEILGWIHIRDGIKNGRIFARHGVRAAGVAFDGGNGRVVTFRPRHWFDQQQGSPSKGVQSAPRDSR